MDHRTFDVIRGARVQHEGPTRRWTMQSVTAVVTRRPGNERVGGAGFQAQKESVRACLLFRSDGRGISRRASPSMPGATARSEPADFRTIPFVHLVVAIDLFSSRGEGCSNRYFARQRWMATSDSADCSTNRRHRR
jgi:hypothetical protein